MAGSPRGAITWRAGDPRLRAALAPLLHDLAAGRSSEALEILRDKPGRRRLARALPDGGPVCFLKLHRGGDKRVRRRIAQRALGMTTAAREFATLRRLRGAGVGVPEPLACARLPGGEEVVVTRFLEGKPLTLALRRPRRERTLLLQAVGRLVARLHAAGHVHRDLHRENVWVTRDGPVLIDLQAAWRLTTPALRRRDAGELDRSLAPLLSLADRIRLRAALLGVERPFSASARRQLRALGAASHARSEARARSRTWRSLVPGRLYLRWQVGPAHGLRLRSADEVRLRHAIEGAADDTLEVLHFPAGGWRWRVGRPSPARHGWIAGHGLRARGVPARRPLAFVERSGWLHGQESWLVLERGGAPPVEIPERPDLAAPPAPDEIRVLGLALARFGIRHARFDALVRGAGHTALPLCRTRSGALGLDPLTEVTLPRRRTAAALHAIDVFVEVALGRATATPEERDAALRRYRRERRFLVHAAVPATQSSVRRPGSSDAASAPPQLQASRGSSSQT